MYNVREILNIADKNLLFSIRNRMKNIENAFLEETEDHIIFSIGTDNMDAHLNGGICLNDSKAEEFLKKIEGVFESLNRDYAIWIRDNDNSRLEEILRGKGLSPTREPGTRCMICDRRINKVNIPEGFSLEVVKTEKHIEDLRLVVGGAFDKDRNTLEVMFNLNMLTNPNAKAIIAYENISKKPVSVASMVIENGVSGIYYVGTLEEYRGRGLGALIAERSTNLGFDLGARMCVLQASELGERVYKKLNYKGIGYYRIYRVEK